MGITFKQGLSVNNRSFDSTNIQDSFQQSSTTLKDTIFSVRVTDIVLNEFHLKFDHVGGWNGIGTIFFESIGLNDLPGELFAFPLNSNCKILPLANELVTIIKIPSKLTIKNEPQHIYYYFPPVGVWNHPNHNASPPLEPKERYKDRIIPPPEDYAESDLGYIRRVEDEGTDINLNFTKYPNNNQPIFKENPIIHPLLPYMGDVIFEGRNGQSIRFGSTSRVSIPFITSISSSNNWSSVGDETSPITIIRNGQSPQLNNEGWIPITENIDRDLSSIYLTSTQQLKNFSCREIYDSYETLPTPPSLWKQPQIAINSDRVVINAKTDNILLSSPKIIGFSSGEGVRVDTNSFNISCNNIKLGSKQAKKSVLLGENTIDVLLILAEAISDLASILRVETSWLEGVPKSSFNPVAGSVYTLINSANGVLSQLKDGSLKSKTTKVQ